MSPTSYQTAPPRVNMCIYNRKFEECQLFCIIPAAVKNNLKHNVFKELVELCALLRSEKGCMWDRQQSHISLLPYLNEETREVAEAVENEDHENLREELGDLLYQVVFHSQIAAETGKFDIYDVIEGIRDKLIRRHPHVFSDTRVSSVEDIKKNWEKIKEDEKK